MSEVALTIDDWSEWTGDEILDRHRCFGMRNPEIGVLRRGASEAGEPAWILAMLDPATEDDVGKGVAPELGVPSLCSAFPIRFCPFCGVALETT